MPPPPPQKKVLTNKVTIFIIIIIIIISLISLVFISSTLFHPHNKSLIVATPLGNTWRHK